MKLRQFLLTLVLFASFTYLGAKETPKFSTAGFYELPESGRSVSNFNPAWRLYKGDIANGESTQLNDASWSVVSLPNGIETVPDEASGCVNYQGIVWYRKHFTPQLTEQKDKVFIHFEGIMGKSKIFLNGELLKEHFGGFLPAIVDVSKHIKWGEPNIIAVRADNSDDPIYPPGKAQEQLDFTYMGGIYRDVWFVSHNETFITDPNFENIKAGGGLIIAFDKVSKEAAEVLFKVHLKNETNRRFKGKLKLDIRNTKGDIIASKNINASFNKDITLSSKFELEKPELWSPEQPNLHYVDIRLLDQNENVIDGYSQRFGIRSLEFKAKQGFWLNGEPYDAPLIGGNRHQDYALVGNAVSNNAHWRDAKKMRDAGFKVVRNAHYPQDPAFMDACDELGLFVIVNTPGWQFWNDEPIFEQRVYQDIRNMVRRDRNRASIWLWEPILNETWYPANFALNTRKVVEQEFPFKNSYSASDQQAHGSEHFDIHFAHPRLSEKGDANTNLDPTKTYFTREWGDNVDDWGSHNSTSRTARNWGERPMLVQAQHYAKEEHPFSTLDNLYRVWKEDRQHIGGTLWHTFDHQRGYHPDPFYGGIMDIYRQPKTSYYMFQSQQKPYEMSQGQPVEPMVYIAHEMTPFSSEDVTVYSNCDEVHLQFTSEGETHIYKRDQNSKGMDYPIITFKNVYDFMVDKRFTRGDNHANSYLLAKGYINGQHVATHKVMPSRRPTKLKLEVDSDGTQLQADGSDFVTVIASITDDKGVVKRLNNYKVIFEVEGQGELINNLETLTNPRSMQWGTAPALIRSTTTAGTIKVKAKILWEGSQMPERAEIEIQSVRPTTRLMYDENEIKEYKLNQNSNPAFLELDKKEVKRIDPSSLKEVEKQQNAFGE